MRFTATSLAAAGASGAGDSPPRQDWIDKTDDSSATVRSSRTSVDQIEDDEDVKAMKNTSWGKAL